MAFRSGPGRVAFSCTHVAVKRKGYTVDETMPGLDIRSRNEGTTAYEMFEEWFDMEWFDMFHKVENRGVDINIRRTSRKAVMDSRGLCQFGLIHLLIPMTLCKTGNFDSDGDKKVK